MEYEIINPSDPYHMTADDPQIAAVAVCLLGNGQYALKPCASGEEGVPFFLFGAGADKWFTGKFGMSYEDTAQHALEHRNDALARAFESVSLTAAERSSMNDIGDRAAALAQAIRRKAGELGAATHPSPTATRSEADSLATP